jgi:putative FmdB family regulatory protein
MPTYEYECAACGHEFELFQQMSEAVKRKCPKCHKRSLQRRVGIGAGVLFKGSGFYETDYRSESYKKAADAEKSAAAGKTEPAKADAGKPAAAGAEAKHATDSKTEPATTRKSGSTSGRPSRKKKSPRKS